MKKTNLEKLFGEFVFTDNILKKYISRKNYNHYMNLKKFGDVLDGCIAKVIAKAIKVWAFKLGATHFSHWFMPLSGKTAEKQVSFIELKSDGSVIENFSEKDLIKGETDASNFPGERMTFEARGYTVWDYTSPVFIKEDGNGNRVLYIPTAFCSYNGTALDEKTPLLRAIESLNTNALRVLKCLGYKDVKRVNFYAGVEQEYFLIKKEYFESRKDLKFLGRTIFGDELTKSQEECCHYFGMIEDDISSFMNEVDRQLWKLGIMAKHQHKEAAPCQFEFVPIYDLVNISNDHNNLIMQVISKTAEKYGLVAIFHEKPFNKINGSGKHENWSLSTDTGINLFDFKCEDRNLFYTFFVSMLAAVDNYSDLLRYSTAYYENDLRLGGDEAPPALISAFVSDYILNDFDSYLKGENKKGKSSLLNIGVKHLPKMVRDFCDRNRTAPFCFNENKFEFRMVGSSQSVAWPSTCVCAALSKTLSSIADNLEKTENNRDALKTILKTLMDEHKRIIFNGNCYEDEWKIEAKNRGLKEYKNTIETMDILDNKNIIDLFISTNILSENELKLRKNANTRAYLNAVRLEAKTMLLMLNESVFYNLDDLVKSKPNIIENNIKTIENSAKTLFELSTKLDNLVKSGIDVNNCEKVLKLMKEIRKEFDSIEKLIPNKFKPFKTYDEILL